MTERPGGSDVGQSETQAELLDEKANTWSVSGFKWFSSATTADLTMLLARTIDPKEGTVKTVRLLSYDSLQSVVNFFQRREARASLFI